MGTGPEAGFRVFSRQSAAWTGGDFGKCDKNSRPMAFPH